MYLSSISMFSLLCRSCSHKNTMTPTNIHNLCYLQIPKSLTFCSISQNQLSPTLSYLTNKCGVPLDSAIKVSHKIKITSTKKADSVLQLLRDYEFTQNQITTLVTKYPAVLTASPAKNLTPKFEFFQSLGMSKSDIAKRVAYKSMLSRSFTKQILPAYSSLKRFLATDEDIVTALIQIYCGFVVSKDFHLRAESNVEVLRNLHVPAVNIRKLLVTTPRAVSLTNDQFKEMVASIVGMGLDPLCLSFVHAIGVMGLIGKLGWENKIETYRRFGWSEADVISAFKRQPNCMVTSEKKIRKMLEFYMNELGLSAFDISEYPNLMMLSLEKRIIPRCSVLQVLASNGLIEKGLNLRSQLNLSKKEFDIKFLEKYKEAIPEVLKAYKGELGYPRIEILRGIL